MNPQDKPKLETRGVHRLTMKGTQYANPNHKETLNVHRVRVEARLAGRSRGHPGDSLPGRGRQRQFRQPTNLAASLSSSREELRRMGGRLVAMGIEHS